MLKKEGLESISDDLNPSWRDILLNLPEDDEERKVLTSRVNPFRFIIILKEMVIFLLFEMIVIIVH